LRKSRLRPTHRAPSGSFHPPALLPSAFPPPPHPDVFPTRVPASIEGPMQATSMAMYTTMSSKPFHRVFEGEGGKGSREERRGHGLQAHAS